MTKINRLPTWLFDIAFLLATAMLVASTLGIRFLNSTNWPTGGDTASHVLYAWLYSDELLFSGHVLPWVPEVFGGLPFLSYYFPLPFIAIAVLSKLTGFAVAFKWGAFLPLMLLPGAVFAASRRWLGMSWQSALFAALGAMAFLFHEQNSIWGGNLLSTLAGEFSYAYSLVFAVLAMMAWVRAVHLGHGWITAALLEAATGFSHGFPLLLTGFSTALLLLDTAHFRRTFWLLFRGHLLAFCLLGGWLWPMLEMHSLTIPNDASFPLESWRDLLPVTLWPVAAAGGVGLLALAFPSMRRRWTRLQSQALLYFIGGAGLAALGFLAGDQLGLADIRFFPLTWVLGAIACGWLAGAVLAWVSANGARLNLYASVLIALAASLGLLGWIGKHVNAAPDWGLWNHSGLDSKPQWQNLSTLFPVLKGDLWSPRLTFEHDPDNNDIGSTRTLEALSIFLNHRPVLEGLYMESAVLGPAVYQLQSELSARPSSPLVRFPSGSLDPEFAARHMNFLHADTALLRSSQAEHAIEASGLYTKIAEASPFAVYRVNNFTSQMIEVVRQPIRVMPTKGWMNDAFAWFRTRSRFDAYLPVYSDTTLKLTAAAADAMAKPKSLKRHEMVFETNAIGVPHLIKTSYHPRWLLESKGQMAVAGPGFLLVVPQEAEIKLVFGHTIVGRLGMAATISALLFLLGYAWQSRRQPAVPVPETEQPRSKRRWALLAAGWLTMLAIGSYLAVRSPEKVYARGWEAMRAEHYDEASMFFDQAYTMRRAEAKKEEALFWLSKSLELAGNREDALVSYRELIDNYHGYWLPETLYTAAHLERLFGNEAAAAGYEQRLREEYPGNTWTLKLDQPQ